MELSGHFHKKAIWLILGGVIFVFALLTAMWIVFMKFHPGDEISRMLQAMSEVQSFHERSAFSWTRGEGRERTTTTVHTIGPIDLSHSSGLQQETKFRVFRVSRAKEYVDLSGEIRTIDGTNYLTYAPPGPDIEGFDFSNETWISLAKNELPAWGSVIPGLDVPGGWGSGSELRATSPLSQTVSIFQNLLAGADIFLIHYNDLTDTIDDRDMRIFDLIFDPDAIRTFLLEMIRQTEGREITDADRVLVETQANALDNLTIRVWIGVEDHLLYRLQSAGAVEGEKHTLIPVDMIVELSDFNAAFIGNVPKKSISFASIARSILGTLEQAELRDLTKTIVVDDVSTLPVTKSETNDDPDGDGLSSIVEAFYRTDPKVFDSDGDGKSDGEEILSGKNPRGEGTLFGFGLGG